MKILTLFRLPETKYGMFGILKDNDADQYICVTLEPQWRDNRNEVSCIPKGEYICKRHDSEKFYKVWEVCNVPNRSEILIHKGNLESQTKGCIILGEGFGVVCDIPAVVSSGNAYSEFTHVLRNEQEFKLVIV